jgi:hypothetical protein
MGMIHFIATKHTEYVERRYRAGSTVIDPWRFIPDQEGVTVKRIGENKPTLISILVPSRGRPIQHARLVRSAVDLATHSSRVEFVTYLDSDDPDLNSYWWPRRDGSYYGRCIGKVLKGERIVLSEMWNECYRASAGEILMHCGDDIVFRTPGWDMLVREAFASSQDKILLVHGDDCSPNTDALATHGFLHRTWVETVGYFVPPYFSSDWNDVWLTEVADQIGRRVKIPIVTEHLHYAFGKAERDQNTDEREERGRRDGVVEIFEKTAHERAADAQKLMAVMS